MMVASTDPPIIYVDFSIEESANNNHVRWNWTKTWLRINYASTGNACAFELVLYKWKPIQFIVNFQKFYKAKVIVFIAASTSNMSVKLILLIEYHE